MAHNWVKEIWSFFHKSILQSHVDEFPFQKLQFALREKCPYSELFWSVFSRIWTEYGEIIRISPYSIQVQENTDLINSECGHFLRCDV